MGPAATALETRERRRASDAALARGAADAGACMEQTSLAGRGRTGGAAERSAAGARTRRVLKRRIATVSPPVASTVPTIQRMSRVSRLAISVRTPEARNLGTHAGKRRTRATRAMSGAPPG